MPRGMNRVGVDILTDGMRNIGLRRQGEKSRAKRVLQALVDRDSAERAHKACIHAQVCA